MRGSPFSLAIFRSPLLLLWLVPWLIVTTTWFESQRRRWVFTTSTPPTPGRYFLSGSGAFRIITWSAPTPSAGISRQGINAWPQTGAFSGLHAESRGIDPLGICERTHGVQIINANAWRLSEIGVRYKPLWWITALGWVPYVRGLRRLRSQRELERRGLCAVCGYDIRASTNPGPPLVSRCPECGTTITVAGA